jgi:hypothetical protein
MARLSKYANPQVVESAITDNLKVGWRRQGSRIYLTVEPVGMHGFGHPIMRHASKCEDWVKQHYNNAKMTSWTRNNGTFFLFDIIEELKR